MNKWSSYEYLEMECAQKKIYNQNAQRKHVRRNAAPVELFPCRAHNISSATPSQDQVSRQLCTTCPRR